MILLMALSILMQMYYHLCTIGILLSTKHVITIEIDRPQTE